MLGVSRSAVAMWENGNREPDLDTLEALADIFNIPMSALLAQDPDQYAELWELRETFRRRPEMRTLFSLTKKASPEDVQKAIEIITILRGDKNDADT